MTPQELTVFRARLANHMTTIDRKECERERKRGRPNIYRLGILLNAVAECVAAIEGGEAPALAFADHFTATRENHKAAVALGLPLDVERGRWIQTAPSVAS